MLENSTAPKASGRLTPNSKNEQEAFPLKRQNTEAFYGQPSFKEYLDFNGTERLRHTSTRTSLVSNSRGVSVTSIVGGPRHLDNLNRRQSVESKASNVLATLPAQTQQTGKLLRHLQIRPGERGFFLWYSVSNSFPIIAASLGPISNLNSVAALADPWRMDVEHNTRPGDFKWILALNAISLFFGCTANISLFLNFSGRVNYVYAQLISIVGWYFAFALLLTILVAAEFLYFNGTGMAKSEGYWHAIFTASFYFISATMLFMNWIGHRKGRYPASFNLTSSQRRIMLQNVLLMIWVGLGGLLFSCLLNMRYTDAIYYCVVTVTTIGLGDVVPFTTLSRALILPYALVGVVYLGLIVTTISSVFLSSTGEAMVFDRTEKARTRSYEKMIQQQQEENPIPPKESFILMRKIHRKARRRRKMTSLYFSLLAFSLFWLLGALVFHFVESSWSYFDGLYFVSLCLLTIGYGDYTPKSSAGRAFFIVWALSAVPMMTILISNLSDNVFVWINDIGDLVTAWLLAVYSVRMQYHTYWKLRFQGLSEWFKKKMHHNDKKGDEEAMETTTENSETTPLDYRPDEEEDALRGEMNHLAEEISDEDNAELNDLTSGSDPDALERTVSLRNRIMKARLMKDPNAFQKPQRVNTAVANIAERMLKITKEIRALVHLAGTDPNHQFTYDDWQRISKIVAGGDLDEISSDFWLSDRSPVRFPVPEVRYFLQECLEGIEVGVYDMVEIMAQQLEHERRKTAQLYELEKEKEGKADTNPEESDIHSLTSSQQSRTNTKLRWG